MGCGMSPSGSGKTSTKGSPGKGSGKGSGKGGVAAAGGVLVDLCGGPTDLSETSRKVRKSPRVSPMLGPLSWNSRKENDAYLGEGSMSDGRPRLMSTLAI